MVGSKTNGRSELNIYDKLAEQKFLI